MTAPIIHIVDDDRSYRTSVSRLVEAASFRWACYESATEFLERLPIQGPGCVLLDLQMPGLSGLELQDRLAQAAPLLPVVFLTGHGNVEVFVRAMKAGAEDFLEKSAPGERLLETIRRALLRYDANASQHDRVSELQALVASLTPREAVVFDLVVRGNRNKEVAYHLGTSERTIKAHRHNLMEKLRVRSLAEAVSIAEKLGMLNSRTRPADR